MSSETVKGFKDIEDASKIVAIRRVMEEVAGLYGFSPVEMPVIEYEDFVKGDNTNDEAVSDIFKLKDKGNRKLALRYEFTFQLKRLAKNKKLPFKRYQTGPVFRDEPVTGNRWRQFTQFDIDVVGSSINEEAEVLKATSEIMERLGIKFKININNRKLLNEILDDLGVKKKELVIREVDKLDKLSEKEVCGNLKKYGAEKVLGILKKSEKFFEKYDSYSEVKELKKICGLYGVKINFVPFLARGLSYYNGSVFEVKGDMKETIVAGGSYMVGDKQATGISFGLERLAIISKIGEEVVRTLVISLGQDKKSIDIVRKVREMGLSCEIFYGKPGKALGYADSKGIDFVIFVGEDEVKKNKFKVKNMKTGKEIMVGESVLGKAFS
jgi:histidyl-tRNA synthetase